MVCVFSMLGQLNVSGVLVCRRCGKSLCVGDSVMSKLSNSRVCRRNQRRVWHLGCWESLFIETKDDSLKLEVS